MSVSLYCCPVPYCSDTDSTLDSELLSLLAQTSKLDDKKACFEKATGIKLSMVSVDLPSYQHTGIA